MDWDAPVQYVKRIGPRRAEALQKEGVATAADLLLYAPFRYEDRTRFRRIAELAEGETACIHVRILAAGTRSTSRARMKIFEMVVRDDSGALNVVFFNQPYLRDILKEGLPVILYGKAERDTFSHSRRFQFRNPEFELLDEDGDPGIHIGRVVPVYRKLGPLVSKQVRTILFQALQDVESVPELLPDDLLARYGFLPRLEALRRIHFPALDPSVTDEERQRTLEELDTGRSPAHRRMIFEEFFLLQAGLQFVAQERKKVAKPHRIEITDRIRDVVRRTLPFKPTSAQKKVIREIVEDMKSPWPMNRLLQGDVGSGKTIVAVQALIVAVENGCQACLMAPTEILAEQHFQTVRALLAHTGYRIALLKSGLPAGEREEIRRGLAAGELNFVVGTHSVIQKDVDFHRLGLAIIDEQHRFGVLQRAELMKKGQLPDILVMTATPIPRTLALTVYGDLALSVLDELPPGRRPPQTLLLRGEKEVPQGYRLIRRELALGHQAYVVYPLIEESENADLRNAVQGFERLSKEEFPEYPVGLLHGRLAEAEKDGVMDRFRRGELKVLVSTTVIEVGIDVPLATVMLVEHAERFGLSQLHQLRGRIGRSDAPAWCVLVAHDLKSEDARRRLEVMVRTTDGFVIAEEDLAIRGPGEFAGTRQSGLLNFRFGSLLRHRDVMELARREAEAFVRRAQAAPRGPEMKRIREMKADWDRRFGLVRVG